MNSTTMPEQNPTKNQTDFSSLNGAMVNEQTPPAQSEVEERIEEIRIRGYTLIENVYTPEELEYVGIEDYFESGAMVLVEWSERGLGVIGAADLEIHLTVDGTSRAVDLEARSERGKSVLQVFNSIYGSCS